MQKVRTRFAPSPTGYLHVGGARTALYSWLFARHYGGEFILRIEDTDLERSSEDSVQAILDSMQWLGLDHDEGPFYQTKRMDHYHQAIEQLMQQGQAYRCYCSRERIEQLRVTAQENKQKPRYDGHCRDLDLPKRDAPYVIRFRNPEQGIVVLADHVYGEIKVNNQELDDLIIQRSDGMPTYNLTVVVDDMEMQITHIIRGDDHINNTPRQINILQALGGKVPEYAHLPMILGDDGKRLSKRHGAVGVMQYREMGILPHALLNYLVRLGWSHGDQEIFSRAEMIEYFNLDTISRGAAAFNTEKLLWLNQQYLKTDNRQDSAIELDWQMQHLHIDHQHGPALADIIAVQAERCKTLAEMAERSRYFYEDFAAFDEKAAQANLTSESLPVLQHVLAQFKAIDDWQEAAIHQAVTATAEQLAIKLGKVAQPIRVALTGNTVSPPIDATVKLLGKQKTIARLEKAIQYVLKL